MTEEALQSLIERDEIKPHIYWPDYQAMGDCRVCGNMREDCDRFQAALAARAHVPSQAHSEQEAKTGGK